MNLKQIIIIREDLCMPVGKLASQVAHSSVLSALSSEYVSEWLESGGKKIVLKCRDEKEIISLADKAKQANIPFALIKDAGKTVFKEPTITSLAIGPYFSNSINEITGYLKIL